MSDDGKNARRQEKRPIPVEQLGLSPARKQVALEEEEDTQAADLEAVQAMHRLSQPAGRGSGAVAPTFPLGAGQSSASASGANPGMLSPAQQQNFEKILKENETYRQSMADMMAQMTKIAEASSAMMQKAQEREHLNQLKMAELLERINVQPPGPSAGEGREEVEAMQVEKGENDPKSLEELLPDDLLHKIRPLLMTFTQNVRSITKTTRRLLKIDQQLEMVRVGKNATGMKQFSCSDSFQEMDEPVGKHTEWKVELPERSTPRERLQKIFFEYQAMHKSIEKEALQKNLARKKKDADLDDLTVAMQTMQSERVRLLEEAGLNAPPGLLDIDDATLRSASRVWYKRLLETIAKEEAAEKKRIDDVRKKQHERMKKLTETDPKQVFIESVKQAVAKETRRGRQQEFDFIALQSRAKSWDELKAEQEQKDMLRIQGMKTDRTKKPAKPQKTQHNDSGKGKGKAKNKPKANRALPSTGKGKGERKGKGSGTGKGNAKGKLKWKPKNGKSPGEDPGAKVKQKKGKSEGKGRGDGYKGAGSGGKAKGRVKRT